MKTIQFKCFFGGRNILLAKVHAVSYTAFFRTCLMNLLRPFPLQFLSYGFCYNIDPPAGENLLPPESHSFKDLIPLSDYRRVNFDNMDDNGNIRNFFPEIWEKSSKPVAQKKERTIGIILVLMFLGICAGICVKYLLDP